MNQSIDRPGTGASNLGLFHYETRWLINMKIPPVPWFNDNCCPARWFGGIRLKRYDSSRVEERPQKLIMDAIEVSSPSDAAPVLCHDAILPVVCSF